MKVAFKGYDAYLNATVAPSDTFMDRTQALINKRFELSSSWSMIGQYDSFVAGTPTTWDQIGARINRMINIDTGVRLGDDWRKLIFQDGTSELKVGKKYLFEDQVWLTINTKTIKAETYAIYVRRCNWDLKWYNKSGNLVLEPCIVEYVKLIGSAMGVVSLKSIREGNYDRFVYLQRNPDTLEIDRDRRFFLDGLVFRVTKIDTIGHFGLVELSLEEHQTNTEIDDVENQIADWKIRPPVDNSNIGTTEIFVGSDTISIGSLGEWKIYKKINGVVQGDQYTFSIIGTGATISSNTGNTVVIQAGIQKGHVFTLRATNTITASVIDFTIQVVSMW